MSNSNLVSITKMLQSGLNHTDGRNDAIKKITIHHMASHWTAERCIDFFMSGNREASSHYQIGYEGEIGQCVSESDIAWTDGNWDSNKISVTIECSNDYPVVEPYRVTDATLQSLIKLVADIAKRNNLGELVVGENLTWHSMYSATACPGNYLRSKMDYIAEEANKINATSFNPLDQYSNEELADLVLEGKFGNGSERKEKLGNRYDAVQDIVNERLYSKPTKSIEEYASEVFDGVYGNGDERKAKLGDMYEQVQAKVNETLEVAHQVIAGNYGNGSDRKNNLTKEGYDYDLVQKVVNILLGVK